MNKNVAPFHGENMSAKDIVRFWDNYAGSYTAFQQGDIPDKVVNYLFETGSLKKEYSVLEIGSGPGTYSMRLAHRVRILTCMDSSASMLKILSASLKQSKCENVELFLNDWTEYNPKKGYDACIATLCPNSGSEESLIRMENSARKSCIIVSWFVNHGDDLHEKIWKKLGKDYSYNLRKSTNVQDWLEAHGRDFSYEVFSTKIDCSVPVEEMVLHEKSAFEAYGYRGIDDIIQELIKSEAEDDVVRMNHINEMKVICWKPE